MIFSKYLKEGEVVGNFLITAVPFKSVVGGGGGGGGAEDK